MRSLRNVLLTAALLLTAAGGAGQPEAPFVPGTVPGYDEVRKALDKVENDPNIAPERTVRTLRWVDRTRQSSDEAGWLNALARWFRGLFEWVAVSGRAIVWVLGGLLAVLVVVYVVQLVRKRGLPRAPPRFVAPSHVRDLDIRPESLPDDVGAAALSLWSSGEQRAALALLYRGLLSRLVHVHDVPIRASATEGECVALARTRLRSASTAYAERMIGTWTAAVYGGVAPATTEVEALCGEFAGALAPRGAGT
ncbi:MAG TPA: DUF4129 domain-containing protein [Gammaproteobacteria bacterium]|nr:DUF4129 domain-containing protein [Gammaproteobacteria bacterium]